MASPTGLATLGGRRFSIYLIPFANSNKLKIFMVDSIRRELFNSSRFNLFRRCRPHYPIVHISLSPRRNKLSPRRKESSSLLDLAQIPTSSSLNSRGNRGKGVRSGSGSKFRLRTRDRFVRCLWERYSFFHLPHCTFEFEEEGRGAERNEVVFRWIEMARFFLGKRDGR